MSELVKLSMAIDLMTTAWSQAIKSLLRPVRLQPASLRVTLMSATQRFTVTSLVTSAGMFVPTPSLTASALTLAVSKVAKSSPSKDGDSLMMSLSTSMALTAKSLPLPTRS